ncbi:MAG: zinc ribbon domain-containing protein [Oscillospiraceae bacterium]|nr:zinc ribbon domain-containing protein [Oscillospiraceae bacterium]
MENQKICQCCAMPLTNAEDFGTNADGSKNGDYCKYCYENGSFGEEKTMEEVIEICIPFCLEAGAYKDAETARAAMTGFFPTLKRWSKNEN